jgi:hypothetical protein
VDSWRRRISQKVEDIQGLIESSKFESGNLALDRLEKCSGDAQLVFVLLLSLARHSRDITQSNVVVTAAVNVDTLNWSMRMWSTRRAHQQDSDVRSARGRADR